MAVDISRNLKPNPFLYVMELVTPAADNLRFLFGIIIYVTDKYRYDINLAKKIKKIGTTHYKCKQY